MSKKVHIIGSIDYFYLALEDRLKRSRAVIVASPNEADITIGIDTKSKCDILIIPGSSNNYNSNIVISIYDLLIPEGKSKWSSNVIHTWLNWIEGNTGQIPDNEVHYWVHMRDAVEVISMIILSDKFHTIEGNIELCGRRAWLTSEVFDELDMLLKRYNNSVNHSHTAESLSQIPNPVKENNKEIRKRPDLSSLNKEIIRAGGDGWHPLTPLRTGLMELLAQNL
jgi:hypothetical protein|tara:strand:+ start:1126 stop:1797 length:672 start_codon:yes stop_codon:yes gene_type:complete